MVVAPAAATPGSRRIESSERFMNARASSSLAYRGRGRLTLPVITFSADETGIDAEQVPHADPQESGADEQHERARHLRHDEHPSRRSYGPSSRAAACALVQQCPELHRVERRRRHEPDQQSAEQPQAEGDARDGGVDLDRRGTISSRARSADSIHAASASPAIAPTTAISSPSTICWRTMSNRPAPMASRVPSSLSRARDRASARLRKIAEADHEHGNRSPPQHDKEPVTSRTITSSSGSALV